MSTETWTPPRRVYFKKHLTNLWKVTDSDGQHLLNADQAFSQMQDLARDGWTMKHQESVVGHILSVTMTEPKREDQ